MWPKCGTADSTQHEWQQGLGTGCLLFLLLPHPFRCLHHSQTKRGSIDFMNLGDTQRIIFFFCSELLNFHPRVRATCSPSLATAGHGPESPIFHIQLNQPTTYLFIYKDLSVNHCFPKGTNKNTVANEGNITSRLSRDHETFCSCQHITEKLSEKLKGENFEGSKRKYFYTVISLQHSLPWDVPEAKATKIWKGTGNTQAYHGCLKLMAVKMEERTLRFSFSVGSCEVFVPRLSVGAFNTFRIKYLLLMPGTEKTMS